MKGRKPRTIIQIRNCITKTSKHLRREEMHNRRIAKRCFIKSFQGIYFALAAWPGFARPPARGVLVVLVQDVSKALLAIGLFRVALV